jgi:hypothetical protein
MINHKFDFSNFTAPRSNAVYATGESMKRPGVRYGLQNNVLRTIGNLPRCTPARDLHAAFNLPYVYDRKTNLCR